MQLYLAPELIKEDAQVLNVISDDDKPVGYIAYLIEEEKKKVYVYGQLENEGVAEDFKDLVTPYLKGLLNLRSGLDVYSYLTIGGEQVELEMEEKEE